MFDLETLDALAQDGDLSAYTLYRAEIAQLSYLSRQEQVELIARARQGEHEARHQLVINCLHWGLMMAHRIYNERRPQHVDVLDLMEEANLHMLEKVDKALTAKDPVAYLMAIAAQTMRVYCTYHAPLIQRPRWYSRNDLQELNRFLPPVESLEKLLPEMQPRKDIAAPSPDLEPNEWQEQHVPARVALLYEALSCLSNQQRATLIRLYGLFGQPAETPNEIAQAIHREPRSVWSYAYQARARLSQVLAEALSWKP